MPDLSPEEEKLAQAFLDGAQYCFWWMGMKYPHFTYQEYFQKCLENKDAPAMRGHIGEYLYYISFEYGKGWRHNPHSDVSVEAYERRYKELVPEVAPEIKTE